MKPKSHRREKKRMAKYRRLGLDYEREMARKKAKKEKKRARRAKEEDEDYEEYEEEEAGEGEDGDKVMHLKNLVCSYHASAL